MAPVAMIFGGMIGIVSALSGWMLFGLSLLAAVQVHFMVSTFVAMCLIVLAMPLPTPRQLSVSANRQNLFVVLP